MPTQPTTTAPADTPVTIRERAAALAAEHDLPPYNIAGDPLSTCTTCTVVVYAVASMGALARRCADHRHP